jgi:hypothetical protein
MEEGCPLASTTIVSFGPVIVVASPLSSQQQVSGVRSAT